MNRHYTEVSTTSNFMYKVYGWMAAALAITAGTAYYIASTPYIFETIFSKGFLWYGVIILQFALVVVLSAMINKLQFSTAAILFVIYSILMGITFSTIFFVFQLGSIYGTFAITAGMFGTMALYGYFTDSDLSSIGSFALMGLFGLIIAMIVNIFLKSESFNFFISLCGVGIFTLLTAYDVQKIKQMGTSLMYRGQSGSKLALLGALTLYLDFINLFLFLLQLMGKKRND